MFKKILNDHNSRWSLILSYPALVLLNFALLSGYICFFGIFFEENDDATMLMLASGAFGGEPQSHLVFINFLYGSVLQFLYLWFPALEWYTLSFLFLHVFSFSIIIKCILSSDIGNGMGKAAMVLLFYVLEIVLLTSLQFTTTAALTTFAGILLLVRGDAPLGIASGILLILIGALIRFHSAQLVMFVSLPFFLIETSRFLKIGVSKNFLFYLLALLLMHFSKYLDARYYAADPAWSEYKEYVALRGMHDNPNLGKVNWQDILTTDFSLYNAMVDTKVFDASKYREVVQQLQNVRLAEKLPNIPSSLKRYRDFFIFLSLLAVSLFIYSRRRVDKVMVLGLFGLFVFSLCWISLDMIPKFRAFLCALLPMLYAPCLIGYGNGDVKKNGFPPHLYIYLAALGYVLMALPQSQARHRLANPEKSERVQAQLEIIQSYRSGGGKKVIPFATSYEPHSINALNISRVQRDLGVNMFTWTAGIPLEEFGPSGFDEILDGPGILFRKEFSSNIPLIAESIKENYGIQTRYQVAVESGDYIIVEYSRQENQLFDETQSF